MKKDPNATTVLLADDDRADCLLLKEAFERVGPPGDLRFVSNGEELLDYVNARGRFADEKIAPRPDLILLDLNMPRKDGRSALRELKADSSTARAIPVVVFTTSSAEADIRSSYEAGASSFVTKPATFGELLALANALRKYWCGTVDLPVEGS